MAGMLCTASALELGASSGSGGGGPGAGECEEAAITGPRPTPC